MLLCALAACAPAASRVDTTALRTAAVIRDFKPDQGENARYKVGSQVRFSYALGQPGFITLVAYDDNGRTYEVERSVRTPAGAQQLPRSDDTTASGARAAYIVDPPVGPQRVFLIYTDRAAPSSARISGNFAPSDLPGVIRAFTTATGSSAVDVAETRFEVVP
jgi:hypothetical protein